MGDPIIRNGRCSAIRALLAHRFCRDKGAWGEWIALKYLRGLGWDILARNWACRRGELDLVAFDQEVLVFVEVKCRKAPSRLPPEEQITTHKCRTLEHLGNQFRRRHGLLQGPGRYDLIAIETVDMREYEIRHYKGFL